MKFLMLLLFPFQTMALTCFDSSSKLLVSVTKDETHFHFEFSAGRGYEAIPQFEGPIAASDLPMIQFQIRQLKELGDHFQISVPIDSCDLKKATGGIFACYREGDIQNSELKFSSLTAYRTKQMHASGDFEIQTFRMLIGKGVDRFFFAMPFPVQSCAGHL